MRLAGLVVLVCSLGCSAQTVQWLTSSTEVVAGSTRVITFGVEEVPAGDVVLDGHVDRPGALEIVKAPEVLAGASIGFVRVRGVAPGEAELSVAGRRIRIDVVEDDREFSLSSPARIVSPASGAVAWGTFGVGVEVFDPEGDMTLRLRTHRGDVLLPVVERGPSEGAWRTAFFEVDASEWPDGAARLTPVVAHADGRSSEGRPVTLRIVHPAPGVLHEGEAEAAFDGVRPERFRDDRRSVGRDREASGGAYFSNASAYPAVCFPVRVETPGLYQMVVRASGSIAGGAPPTVGVVVDGDNQPVTNGRLVATGWHRAVIGVPFHLDAGEHVLTPFFMNDFYVPRKADRNLRLDRIEVMRVGDGAGEAGGGMMGAMMSGAMMAAGELGGLIPDDGGMSVPDPYGESGHPLRIGLETPLEGRVISGDLGVRAQCWWVGAEQGPGAPVVELVVNGERVGSQRSGHPHFIIDAASFVAGSNSIQLAARHESGATAATPVQTMWYSPDAAAGARSPRRFVRWSIHEEAWDDATRAALTTAHYPGERQSAGLYSNGSLRLTLPEDLAGTFVPVVEMRGQHFDGAPVVRMSLEAGGETTSILEREVPGWWGPHFWQDEVTVAPGEKTLVVSFVNDTYEEGVGDRNVWVQSVALHERPTGVDRAAPVVDLLYPPSGQRMHMADVVVAHLGDDHGVVHVELLIDDVPTGISVNLTHATGEVVLPLLLRELEPGEITVSLQARDAAGNVGWSAVRPVRVVEAPAERTAFERAVVLLNRFAYGPDPQELAAVLTMGEQAWLRDRLSRGADEPGELAALGQGHARFPQRRDAYSAVGRTLDHAMLTPNPVRARFVFFMENHFSTWIRKVEGDRKWDEHVAFTRLGAARFQELLETSAHSPAMLRYLDQDQSFAGRINENYAREIMELHTLGVDGGYSQEDVTTLANLLTGWTASAEGDGRSGGQSRDFTFRYDPALNDVREMRVVGMRFPEVRAEDRYDRVRLLVETLSAHPNTARFVCRKVAEHYVGMGASDELVEDLALVFEASGGDMAEVLIALSEHPAFWSAEGDKIAQPIDYCLRLSRTSSFINPWQLQTFLASSGAGLFDRSTPDGYPEADAAYADSNALVQRWRLARTAQWSLVNLVPGPWRWGSDDVPEDVWAQRVVDVVAVRLTGSVLSPASNEAAVNLLLETEGNRQDRAFTIAPIIAQMPEASLR